MVFEAHARQFDVALFCVVPPLLLPGVIFSVQLSFAYSIPSLNFKLTG